MNRSRSRDNVSTDTTATEATLTGVAIVLLLGKMMQMEKRKKPEDVSHASTSYIKAELTYKRTLWQMCYITDVSCPQQNHA